MARELETAVFLAEAAAMAAVSVFIDSFEGRDRPDWLVPEIAAGCIISGAPAILLARLTPTTWRDYERRALIGFSVGLAVVGPWQLWQLAQRLGEKRGYAWNNDDKSPQMERPA